MAPGIGGKIQDHFRIHGEIFTQQKFGEKLTIFAYSLISHNLSKSESENTLLLAIPSLHFKTLLTLPPPSTTMSSIKPTTSTGKSKIDVEQAIHELVSAKGGTFSNEQVADLFSQNLRLRFWIRPLAGLVALLALTSIGAIYAAVGISTIAVIATGEEHVITWQRAPMQGESDFACVSTNEVLTMWNSTMQGTPTTLVSISADDEATGAMLTASGSFFNSTHMCFMYAGEDNDGHDHICAKLAGDNRCAAPGTPPNRERSLRYEGRALKLVFDKDGDLIEVGR